MIRRFYGVAVEMHMMLIQEKGDCDPAVLHWVMRHDYELAWADGEKAKAKAQTRAAKPTKPKALKFIHAKPKGWPTTG